MTDQLDLPSPKRRGWPMWLGWAGARARAMDGLVDTIQAQRDHRLPWAAIWYATGIGIYFSLGREPSGWLLSTLLLGAALFAVLAWRTRYTIGPLLWCPVLLALGIGVAAHRTALQDGPIIDWRYYGPVQGRVVGLDRSSSDKPRVTLDSVVLERVAPFETPKRVRISLHGEGAEALSPGATVLLTAHLSRPPGPSEPGGFDFQRHAFFLELGAVGYSRVPVVTWEAAAPGDLRQRIFQIRMAISRALQEAIPGQPGAIAAAITTGDRSAMSTETYDALRFSNLAHLLAISGLHMGLLTGFVFGAVRVVLSLHPTVALYWPVKKIAAVVALVAGAIYLALSGGSVATERAFVMVALVLIAVMLDRRALTLRAVALAAFVVLTLRPEALLSPGFQMSFAATTALVLFFGWFSRYDYGYAIPDRLRPAVSLFLASFVAGLATAPFAAAHFNIISHYGLLANMLATPLMGLLIMPAAVVAALLWPLGLAQPALWAMEAGIRWILWVGHWVSDLPGAVGRIWTPPEATLAFLALGALWLVLWQGRARVAGAVVLAFAFALWALETRPLVLISERASLVGVLTPEGRVFSREKGEAFAARSWLENDGDARPREEAVAPAGFLPHPTLDILHVHGKRDVAALTSCQGADILVASHPAPDLPCRVIDPTTTRTTGALAIYPGPRIVSAKDLAGIRPWTDPKTKAWTFSRPGSSYLQ